MVVVMLLICSVPHCLYSVGNKITTTTTTEITDGYEMMHKAWSSIEEAPYCFSRPYVKLQGHTAQTIVDFDPN